MHGFICIPPPAPHALGPPLPGKEADGNPKLPGMEADGIVPGIEPEGILPGMEADGILPGMAETDADRRRRHGLDPAIVTDFNY